MFYLKKGDLKDLFSEKLLDDLFTFPNTVRKNMNANLVEYENEYKLTVEIPGVNKEDIKISYEDDYLQLEVERKEEKEQKEGEYHYKEIKYGMQSRKFQLPEINKEAVKATFIDGVLNLTLPKQVKENLKTYIDIE